MSLLMRFLSVWLVVTVTDAKHFLQFKVWVKPGAEQSFLYGNHVLKSGLGRITENTMQYQGVVVYSMADVPLVSFPKACSLGVTGVLHTTLDLSSLSALRVLALQPSPLRNVGGWIPCP